MSVSILGLSYFCFANSIKPSSINQKSCKEIIKVRFNFKCILFNIQFSRKKMNDMYLHVGYTLSIVRVLVSLDLLISWIQRRLTMMIGFFLLFYKTLNSLVVFEISHKFTFFLYKKEKNLLGLVEKSSQNYKKVLNNFFLILFNKNSAFLLIINKNFWTQEV